MSIESWGLTLVCAAHPDDETVGAGGTIVRLAASLDVHLVVFTKAHAPQWSEKLISQKREETRVAAAQLGINGITFLDYPAARLDTIPQHELNDRLRGLIVQLEPSTVLAPHYGDVHSDHRLVFEAAVVATRPLPGSCVRRLLAFECLSSSEWSAPVPAMAFLPQLYVGIEQTLEAKIHALKAYASEIREFPHPRSVEAIRALAVKRGSEVGMNAAEAFQLIRELQ